MRRSASARTGKPDGAIDHSEAMAIARNAGLPEPTGWSGAASPNTPPAARKQRPPLVLPKPPPQPATDYTTESRGAFAAAPTGLSPSRDAFLAKLQEAEKMPPTPKGARLALIPRIE